MGFGDINSIIRDAARTLLVLQAFYQEIIYKCILKGNLSQLKINFSNKIIFLNELFKSENKEIDSIFPNERISIL
jgi:hypothetical protein